MSFRREPAILVGILVALVQAITAFWFATEPTTQGLVNAGAVAIGGAVVAFAVRSDNLLPALTGAAQAIIACFVGFGFDWAPTQQAALMAPIALLAAYVVRYRVTAPVPSPVVAQAA
jgi:hypothetical protein